MTDPVERRWPEDEPAVPGHGQPPAVEPAAESTVVEPAADESPAGPTGHPVVDAAVARLAEQADLPPAEQVAGYEAAQRALHQTLASIDQT